MKKAAILGAANFRYFADKTIDARNGLSTPDANHLNFTVKQAIGPVGGVHLKMSHNSESCVTLGNQL